VLRGLIESYDMTSPKRPIGVLLLQLGTPDSTSVSDVRRYLREFLSDPRVLDIPAPARALLLNAVILPFRPRRSAEAYEKIWTPMGSPLTIFTAELSTRVQEILGDGYRVAFGMRYQNPSIEEAVDQLTGAGCDEVVILPLFPQYASAAGGSAAEKALQVLGERWNVPSVRTVGTFYDNAGFLASVAHVARPMLAEFAPDHVLFSYHGLPEKQVKKSDVTGAWCLASEGCCDRITDANRFCYRAQCFATTRGLVEELGLVDGSYSTTFQSRLAGQKWIEPYTDKELAGLHRSGVRRLAVLTPSFTADCLETIEEIGIRLREQWEAFGGTELLRVPCVNADEGWARAVADMVTADQ
jgi:protoporphyrin/coproporphyrin ferrochelatase